jgi:uncharacterized protein (TIGR03437 family)
MCHTPTLRTDFRPAIVAAILWAHFPAAALPRPALNFEKNFGGTGIDAASAIAVDRAGNTYVAGTTTSLDFPVANAFQPHIGGTPLRMSSDQGATWLAPAVPAPVFAVAGSPKQPNVVFAGTANGILKSLDSGKTWTSVAAASTYWVNALVVDSVNPDLVYAATTSGTYQSRDGGMTWRLVDHGGWEVLALVSAPTRSTTLFSAIETGGSSPGVYRTTDSGSTWSLLVNAPLGAFSLACDPANPDVLYAATAQDGLIGGGNPAVYKTTDAGDTWIKLADLPVSISTFTLAASTAAVYVGTDNGVLLSRDGGVTWTQTSVKAAADNIAVDPTNPQIVYASAGGIFRTTDGGTTWSPTLAVRQNVQTLAIVPTNPPTIFVGATPGQNIFVTKWSADGKQMLYSTYLGGSYYDFATGIAVDNQGNAYVTGYTFSQDFPVTPDALQAKNSGSSNAFLAKIGPQGDKLLYATYLGGSTGDAASAIALDSAGNAYLTGYAGSSDFPVTAGAQQNRLRENCTTPPSRYNLGDAFVAKINADTSHLVYSTFLGGTCGEQGLGIAVDPAGNAAVVGLTDSIDFPVTAGALQPKYTGGAFSGFLATMTPQGSLSYATFLGGAGDDTAEAVALDAQGGVYVAGSTFGFDATQFGGNIIPSSRLGAVYPFAIGFPFEISGAAYVLKLNSATWMRTYLKYVGADFGEAKAIAVDTIGRAWVTGTSDYPESSPTDPPFPTVHPFQAKSGPGFVSELSADGSTLLFSSDADGGNALSLDASGNAFVAGSTLSGVFTFNGSVLSAVLLQTPLLIRIDADVPSSVTVEEPQRLIPKMGSEYYDGIAPGELLVLTGSGLGPDQEVRTQLTAEGKIATTLAGTTVTFDGVPAPLLSVQSGRIVCIAPFAVGDSGFPLPLMQVQSNMVLANAIRLGTVATAIGALAVVNPDGSGNSPDHPTPPNSIVTMYVTGLGQTTPPSVDGEVSVAGPRKFQVGPIHVNIDGSDAEVAYIGAAPGQVSAITQIDFRVPALPPGQYTLKVGWGSPLQDFSAFLLNVGY